MSPRRAACMLLTLALLVSAFAGCGTPKETSATPAPTAPTPTATPIAEVDEEHFLLVALSANVEMGGKWQYTAEGAGEVVEIPLEEYYAALNQLGDPIPGSYQAAFKGEKPGEVTLAFTCSEIDDEENIPKKTFIYQIMVTADGKVETVSVTESGEAAILIPFGIDIMSDEMWSYTASGDGAVKELTFDEYDEILAEERAKRTGESDDGFILDSALIPGSLSFMFVGEKPGVVTLEFTLVDDSETEKDPIETVTVTIDVYPDKTLMVTGEDSVVHRPVYLKAYWREYVGDDIIEYLNFKYRGMDEELFALYMQVDEFVTDAVEFYATERDEEWVELLAYPFTGERYIQLIITKNVYPAYANDGAIASFVYDQQEYVAVTTEMAMEESQITLESLTELFKQQVEKESGKTLAALSVDGFRYIDDGPKAEFFVGAEMKTADGEEILIYVYNPETKEFRSTSGLPLFDFDAPDVFDPPLAHTRAADMVEITDMVVPGAAPGKQNVTRHTAHVREVYPASNYEVVLDDGIIIPCTLSSKLRLAGTKVSRGAEVDVEVEYVDRTPKRGVIVYIYK